jgi:uncharacterized protein (TIGR00297 family)
MNGARASQQPGNTRMAGFSEIRRQITHILVGAFALLLRWLTVTQAAAMAIAAIAFNLLILPRVGRNVFRAGDLDRVAESGIVIYPVAVLGLILLFPHRPDIAAASWAILAAGDGLATLVGAHVASPKLPWNRDKSAAGLVAGAAGAAAAGVFLACWTSLGMSEPPPVWFIYAAPAAAALAAAFVETVPIRLNDNISVPFTAAFVMWSLSFVDLDVARAHAPSTMAIALAAGVNAIVAVGGWAAKKVTAAGALTGAAIGIAVWIGAGGALWSLLFVSFAIAAITTGVGHKRKAALGIAEERGGRRGPGNAIANTGIFAWAALLSMGLEHPAPAILAGVTAMVTAASDTVASEIGKAFGRTTWSWAPVKRVPPGTAGAVSLEGTLAGMAAALVLALYALGLGIITVTAVPVVVVAATLASFAEGALAARFEPGGWLNNDVLNFLNSAIGASLALLWWALS